MQAENVDRSPVTDDADLLRRLLEGDALAGNALSERYRDLLFRIAFRILGNESDAEDAVQDALVRLARYGRSYDARSSVRTWLCAIVRNTALDALKKRRRASTAGPVCDGGEAAERTANDSDLSPEERLHQKQQLAFVNELLGSLTPRERYIYLSREADGAEFEEIGNELGEPLRTAQSTHRRVKNIKIPRRLLQLRKRMMELGLTFPAFAQLMGVGERELTLAVRRLRGFLLAIGCVLLSGGLFCAVSSGVTCDRSASGKERPSSAGRSSPKQSTFTYYRKNGSSTRTLDLSAPAVRVARSPDPTRPPIWPEFADVTLPVVWSAWNGGYRGFYGNDWHITMSGHAITLTAVRAVCRGRVQGEEFVAHCDVQDERNHRNYQVLIVGARSRYSVLVFNMFIVLHPYAPAISIVYPMIAGAVADVRPMTDQDRTEWAICLSTPEWDTDPAWIAGMDGANTIRRVCSGGSGGASADAPPECRLRVVGVSLQGTRLVTDSQVDVELEYAHTFTRKNTRRMIWPARMRCSPLFCEVDLTTRPDETLDWQGITLESSGEVLFVPSQGPDRASEWSVHNPPRFECVVGSMPQGFRPSP